MKENFSKKLRFLCTDGAKVQKYSRSQPFDLNLWVLIDVFDRKVMDLSIDLDLSIDIDLSIDLDLSIDRGNSVNAPLMRMSCIAGRGIFLQYFTLMREIWA